MHVLCNIMYVDVNVVVDRARNKGIYGYLSFTPLPNFGWPTFNVNASISVICPHLYEMSLFLLYIFIYTCPIRSVGAHVRHLSGCQSC